MLVNTSVALTFPLMNLKQEHTKMNKLILSALIAVLSLGLGQVSHAQDAGPKKGKGAQAGKGMPGGRMAKMNQEIFQKLNLTKDQEAKMKELGKKQQEAMKSAFEAAGGDREKMMASMRELRPKMEADMKKILTDAQFKKYETLRKEMREKMRGQGRGPGGPGGPGAGKPGGGI